MVSIKLDAMLELTRAGSTLSGRGAGHDAPGLGVGIVRRHGGGMWQR